MAALLDESYLLIRAAFDARELAERHPPRLTHAEGSSAREQARDLEQELLRRTRARISRW